MDFKRVCLGLYLTLQASLFLTLSFYVKDWADNASNLTTYPTMFMNQISADWNSTMIGDLIVQTGASCPTTHPTTVVSRRYYGAGIGCDCLGIRSEYITCDNSFCVGAACDYN
jgi:hypothetical protein